MNQTLLGRMVMGPAIGIARFWSADFKAAAEYLSKADQGGVSASSKKNELNDLEAKVSAANSKPPAQNPPPVQNPLVKEQPANPPPPKSTR